MPLNYKPLPSLEYLVECFELDRDTGLVYWKQRPREHFRSQAAWLMTLKRDAGRLAGHRKKDGYLYIGVGRSYVPGHRVIWALFHMQLPPIDLDVDHIDGDPTNNHPSNLRLATRAQNVQNSAPRKEAKYKGVRRHKGGVWEARITPPAKTLVLGYFKTPEEAASAYDEAARKLFGKYARLNFGVKND